MTVKRQEKNSKRVLPHGFIIKGCLKAILILNKKEFIRKALGSSRKWGRAGNKSCLQGLHVMAQTHSLQLGNWESPDEEEWALGIHSAESRDLGHEAVPQALLIAKSRTTKVAVFCSCPVNQTTPHCPPGTVLEISPDRGSQNDGWVIVAVLLGSD